MMGIAVLVTGAQSDAAFSQDADPRCLRILLHTDSDWTSVSIDGAPWEATGYEILEGSDAPDLRITSSPDLGVNKSPLDQAPIVVSFRVLVSETGGSMALAIGKGHIGTATVTVYDCSNAEERLVDQFTHIGIAPDPGPRNQRVFSLSLARPSVAVREVFLPHGSIAPSELEGLWKTAASTYSLQVDGSEIVLEGLESGFRAEGFLVANLLSVWYQQTGSTHDWEAQILVDEAGRPVRLEWDDGMVMERLEYEQPVGSGTTSDSCDPMLILHDGIIHTMTEPNQTHEAVVIGRDGRIKYVGDHAGASQLAQPCTQWIDLNGQTVVPGFIDPHTHFLEQCNTPVGSHTALQAQALRMGITMMGEMHVRPEWLTPHSSDYRRWQEWNHIIRQRLYVVYNDSCGVLSPATPTWLTRHQPDEALTDNLVVGGVKFFAERSMCPGYAFIVISFSEKLRQEIAAHDPSSYYINTTVHKPLFTPQTFASAIKLVSDAGYQIAVHAFGELGVQTTLDAIGVAASRGAYVDRPLILHNVFLRDDQLGEYVQHGAVALVEPLSPCCEELDRARYGDGFVDAYYTRWNDLVQAGVTVASDSDWPSLGHDLVYIDPLRRFRAIVTRQQTVPPISWCVHRTGDPCCGTGNWSASCGQVGVNQTVSAEEGLRMLTSNAAYALRCEADFGMVWPGKIADLVVLSSDPLHPQADLESVEVTRTIIGGVTQYKK